MYLLGIPFRRPGHLKRKSCGAFVFRPSLLCAFGGTLQRIHEGNVSISGWVPVLQLPSVALTQSFSSQLHSPRFLKPEKLQQSSGSLTNPRTRGRFLCREAGSCLAPGTPAENVFAGDVSRGTRSSQVSMSSAFPVTLLWMHLGLAALGGWGSQSPIWLPVTFVGILCHPRVNRTSDSNFCQVTITFIHSCALKFRSVVVFYIALFGIGGHDFDHNRVYFCISQVED